MQFIIIASDKPGMLDVRKANRAAHLEYWPRTGPTNPLAAGPRLGFDGNPIGSVLVIDAENLDQAKEFLASDPYTKAGLFDTTIVEAFRLIFQNGHFF